MTPELKRKHSLSSNYKMTPEQWETMFESQGRACAICSSDSPGGAKYWATDHDHDTGMVRGILCSNCNLGIGYFKDSCDTIIGAAMYLLQHQNVLEYYS